MATRRPAPSPKIRFWYLLSICWAIAIDTLENQILPKGDPSDRPLFFIFGEKSFRMKKSLLLLLSITSLPAFAQVDALKTQAAKRADELQNQVVAWRRDFHEHPELG